MQQLPGGENFEDGQPHQGEETGFNRDGSKVHWIFRTSPIKNTEGQIVAVLEMSLDITERKELEEKLETSERKYHEIFNHIPNPVFVLITILWRSWTATRASRPCTT